MKIKFIKDLFKQESKKFTWSYFFYNYINIYFYDSKTVLIFYFSSLVLCNFYAKTNKLKFKKTIDLIKFILSSFN